MADVDKRASLSARLTSLFSADPYPSRNNDPNHPASEPSSRRRSLEASLPDSMRIARTRPPSPRYSHLNNQSRATHTPKAFSMNLSLPLSSKGHSTSAAGKTAQRDKLKPHPMLPAIRWLAGQNSGIEVRQSLSSESVSGSTLTHSPTQASPSHYFTSQQVPPSPSAYSAIADALDDDPKLLEVRSHTVDLPSRPEAARLAHQFHAGSSRPPNLLSNLARSTLPTAGLSPPPIYSTKYSDPFEDPFKRHEHNPDLDILYSPTPSPVAMPPSPAPAHLPQSPPTLSLSPTRTSIDSLRSIQERGTRAIHTTSPSQRLTLPNLSNPLKGWFASDDSKENMDPFLSEEDRAPTAEAQKQRIRENYAAPKNPVVFCHGLLGFDTVTVGPSIAPVQVSHWRGIKDALEANGVEVLITRVPATSTPIVRAKVLEEKISAAYPGRSVHLIGHSMGGLDCRYLTTHLTHRTFKVLSITTISSPHHGSSFADHFLKTVGHERMPSILSLLDMLPNGGGDGKAFQFLTVENMRKFNEATPDVHDVKYFSWGATYEPGLIDTWKWSHSVILEKEGPNDGLVSLDSAKWGTYLGTLEGVNHLDLVGWVNTARYKWAEIMGREIKFKPATFYLGIADHLARVVEGQEAPQEPEALEGSELSETASLEEREEVEEIRRETERLEMVESLRKGEEEEREKMNGNGKIKRKVGGEHDGNAGQSSSSSS